MLIRKFQIGFKFLLLTCALIITSPAFAADIGSEDAKIEAIQNRIFQADHELGMGLAYIPDDDFYHALPISLTYAYHYNELWGLDLRGAYVFNQDRDLKKTLESEYGVTASEFNSLEYMAHAHVTYTPFYGKDSFLNKSVINHETYFFAGAGTVNYYVDVTEETSESLSGFSVSFGVGKKIFISDHFVMNIEIRDLVNITTEDTINNIVLGINFGYRFNLSPRKTKKSKEIEALGKYLDETEND